MPIFKKKSKELHPFIKRLLALLDVKNIYDWSLSTVPTPEYSSMPKTAVESNTIIYKTNGGEIKLSVKKGDPTERNTTSYRITHTIEADPSTVFRSNPSEDGKIKNCRELHKRVLEVYNHLLDIKKDQSTEKKMDMLDKIVGSREEPM